MKSSLKDLIYHISVDLSKKNPYNTIVDRDQLRKTLETHSLTDIIEDYLKSIVERKRRFDILLDTYKGFPVTLIDNGEIFLMDQSGEIEDLLAIYRRVIGIPIKLIMNSLIEAGINDQLIMVELLGNNLKKVKEVAS